MNVLQIATQAQPQRVMELYREAYETDHGYSASDVVRWAALVRAATPENTLMEARVYLTRDAPDEDECYTVDGVCPEGRQWALEFTPWGQWRQMAVVDATGKGLCVDALAAHVMYEMTFCGWPEQMEERRDSLMDTVEQIKRDLATGTPLGQLAQLSYTEFKGPDDLDPPEE